MDIVLLPGLWLTSDVWGSVADELERLGHHAIAVTLPGADDRDPTRTLDDQIDAVLDAVDAADRPLVVGHSAASTLAWLAADRRPEAVAGAVMIGGFPSADGSSYAAFFEIVAGVMAFPGWEPFEGPDAADLDEATRARLAGAAVPVPEGVAHGTVRLTDERRFAVPVTLICPEFGPDDVRSWMAAGDLPELERVASLRLVDIDSGHWPMVTRPTELARLLAGAAED